MESYPKSLICNLIVLIVLIRKLLFAKLCGNCIPFTSVNKSVYGSGAVVRRTYIIIYNKVKKVL